MNLYENRIEPLHFKVYTGVYLLYKLGALVYVGVSNDIYFRLSQHSLSEKNWDEVRYIEELDYYRAILIENYFIETFSPIYNKATGKLKMHELVQGKGVSYLKKNYPSGWET